MRPCALKCSKKHKNNPKAPPEVVRFSKKMQKYAKKSLAKLG
jgi:hypothetical protein